MLSMADQNGYVGASVPGLAARSRVDLTACVEAIGMLSAPDAWSRSKEHEGRRITEAPGGWVLLNHARYRATQNADDRRERSRLAMQDLRSKNKAILEKNNERQQKLTVNSRANMLTMLAQAEAATNTTPTPDLASLETDFASLNEKKEEHALRLEETRTGKNDKILEPRDKNSNQVPNAINATPAGTACKAMKKVGLMAVNPSDPRLAALLAQGVTADELAAIAAEGVAKGKGWAWVLAVVQSRRVEAAQIAITPAGTGQPDIWAGAL